MMNRDIAGNIGCSAKKQAGEYLVWIFGQSGNQDAT